MGKTVVFAVAGSGKTTLIISKLDLKKRVLLITYTENNYRHLHSSIIARFSYFPSHITLMTYFEFLHSFCYRPFLQIQLDTRGMNFSQPPNFTNRFARSDLRHYCDQGKRLYHNRLAKLLDHWGVVPYILARIEKYYDALYVDEVQDFAGNDFNLLKTLCRVSVDILFVGDFFQHTFDTSRDGPVNRSLHEDIKRYEKQFSSAGLHIDRTTLSQTWRCSRTTCEFITRELNISIQDHSGRTSTIKLVETQAEADALHADEVKIKLFYQSHTLYGCLSQNWGASKGLDHYQDICIILSPMHWKLLTAGKLETMKPGTRNKLYVACSRARGDIYFIPENLFKRFKIKQ
ncbi:hypothetical protein Rahaq_5111 (plasmid) [Rahnella aceris]|uniref:Uncharacterized protein n=1 Tax=Rahnella sp. (strain Y9602) TaxID=2703885 RepID=A0A0H3FHK9_RAHSY|nr:AAA family ATPase [Rahnella aceris]ADW76677.1 hypothetical protein Rahaq_5111 [Rahnella aceris]